MKVIARHDRIRRAGGDAVFVVHDPPEVIRAVLLDDVDPPFPIVVDLARRTYHDWGLDRAPWWRIWLDPQVWRQYARLLSAGERIRGSGGDIRQLGGDFVVGPGGRIVYARPQRRDDRPAVGELVDRLEEVAV